MPIMYRVGDEYRVVICHMWDWTPTDLSWTNDPRLFQPDKTTYYQTIDMVRDVYSFASERQALHFMKVAWAHVDIPD